jgi:exopolysaccharide biosynthesis polyprenyl glycosylphosphotransferase
MTSVETEPEPRVAAPAGPRPIPPGRVLRLRQGHILIAGLWFAIHELSRGATVGRAALALLYTTIWYACIRYTLLRESRAGPSWALTIVRAAEGAVIAAGIIIALHTVFERSDPLAGEVGAVAAVALLAFLWHAAVAGHRSLGEPLRCIVVGPAAVVHELEEERLAPGARPFQLLGWIDDPVEPGPPEETRAPRLGDIDDLERIAYGGGVDVFILGVRAGRPAIYARLLELTHLDVSVIEYPAFFERTFGRVPLNELTPTWFLHTMHLHRRDEAGVSKRVFDLLLAAVGLVLASPILLGAAIAVRLWGGPGPILFRQIRIGEHGKQFTMVKFRSMNATEAGDETTWTATDDPRITAAGRWLRRFRIDELPQLVNVLEGTMTLVGPRPETPDYVRWLAEEIPFYQPRHFAKPGITGWAQVCGGYASSLDSSRLKLSYDLYYLRNRSFSLDAAILLRTVGIVFAGHGSR